MRDDEEIAGRELLREQIARDLGFRLFSHYGEQQAASYLDIHPVTLKKLRLAGSIGYVAKGRRAIAYFGGPAGVTSNVTMTRTTMIKF